MKQLLTVQLLAVQPPQRCQLSSSSIALRKQLAVPCQHLDAAYVVRTVGDENEPRRFSTWAAKAVALIGHLPDTLADRSLAVPMRRRAASEHVERLRLDRAGGFEDLDRGLIVHPTRKNLRKGTFTPKPIILSVPAVGVLRSIPEVPGNPCHQPVRQPGQRHGESCL